MVYNYTYNTSFDADINSSSQFFTGINQAANGLPAIGALVIIWLAVFFATRTSGGDTLEAFTVSSFAATVIAALMFFMVWISWQILLIPIVLLVFGVIALRFR